MSTVAVKLNITTTEGELLEQVTIECAREEYENVIQLSAAILRAIEVRFEVTGQE